MKAGKNVKIMQVVLIMGIFVMLSLCLYMIRAPANEQSQVNTSQVVAGTSNRLQKKSVTTSWTLDDQTVKSAIAYGKKCKTPRDFFKPWTVHALPTKYYSCDDCIIVATPYYQIACISRDSARLYKPLDMKEIETIRKGRQLIIIAVMYGDEIDFAADIPAVIKVNGKVIHPIDTIPQRLANISSSWPEWPAYWAQNIYIFDTKHIPRNAKIWFILIRLLGEEKFHVDLSTVK